jgi:hypothetical protein
MPMGFHQELLRVWQAAGAPSMRRISVAIGVPHTTVHGQIKGQSVPTRDNAEKLVLYLVDDAAEAGRIMALYDAENSVGDTPEDQVPLRQLLAEQGQQIAELSSALDEIKKMVEHIHRRVG